MKLSSDERAVLDGAAGATMARVMAVIVRYGEVMDAARLLPIEGCGHFSVADPGAGVGLRLEMLEELVEGGCRTTFPFTLDPRPPLDLAPFALTTAQVASFRAAAAGQARYHELMLALGLRDESAYTCTPYLEEVGNRPARGTVIAWSESSCIIFANSVLGARTNRNAGIIDLFCNIAGVTPAFGLVREEGRLATWLVDVRVPGLPDPQVLGEAIAAHVVDQVPFITGLAHHFAGPLDHAVEDYLKEMGAASAAVGGGVGLMHVEGLTPEVRDEGRRLLCPGHRAVTIDSAEIRRIEAGYAAAARSHPEPQRCLVGCPHLSLAELKAWAADLESALTAAGRRSVAVETIFAAAPAVLEDASAGDTLARLTDMGATFTPACFEAFMSDPHVVPETVVTTSNKLRAYTGARWVSRDSLVGIAAGRGGNADDRDRPA